MIQCLNFPCFSFYHSLTSFSFERFSLYQKLHMNAAPLVSLFSRETTTKPQLRQTENNQQLERFANRLDPGEDYYKVTTMSIFNLYNSHFYRSSNVNFPPIFSIIGENSSPDRWFCIPFSTLTIQQFQTQCKDFLIA